MRTQILALALILAACGKAETPTPEGAEPAVVEAPAPPTPLSTGAMGAMSNTAMAITGALTVTPTSLQFEKGFTASTETIAAADPAADIAEGGSSYADIAPSPAHARIELRRIMPQAPQQLCGSQTPASYVALVHDEPLTGLTLIVFSGAEAPGPEAHDSAVCATFSYAAD